MGDNLSGVASLVESSLNEPLGGDGDLAGVVMNRRQRK
jgi:hypothetical protein